MIIIIMISRCVQTHLVDPEFHVFPVLVTMIVGGSVRRRDEGRDDDEDRGG